MNPSYREVLKLFYENIQRTVILYDKILSITIEYNNANLELQLNPSDWSFHCLYDSENHRCFSRYSVIARVNEKYYIRNNFPIYFREREIIPVPQTKDEWFNHHIQDTRFSYEDYLTFQKICEYYDDISRST